MSWKQHLFKPKWQHKDPEIRKEAVASLLDSELMSALPEICAGDEDKAVRSAAAKRIEDPELLINLLKKEAEAETVSVIRHRVISLCTSTSEKRPSLKSRQNAINSADIRELFETVAIQAPEAELRKLALGKVERQGFLGDRAAGDPDPSIRRYAASLVTQVSTLKRVIEQTRKSDKSLYTELQERLHEELLESGDADAIQKEAVTQCEALEAFSLQHLADAEKIPAGISARWSKIEDRVSMEMSERYQRISELISQPRVIKAPLPEPVAPKVEASNVDFDEADNKDADANEAGNPEVTVEVPTAGQIEDPEQDPPTQKLADKMTVEADLARESALNEAKALLSVMDQQLEDGALHNALETRHRLSETGKPYKGNSDWKKLNSDIAQREPRLRELREWQHWSNDKVRKKLIAEMEILPQADLHPDALLDRIKSLQSEWKTLEKSEQIPGDSRYHTAAWMWRKFKTAGNNAFDAAKPFLEKRDEIRDKQIDSQKALCEQLRKEARADSPDWVLLTKLIQSTRKELRELDNMPHKLRKAAASRLRKALDSGNAAMRGHYDDIEKKKLKLVREAAQLVYVEDHDEAIREAKRLQAEWKSAGRLWRARENELWTSFREPLDPLFEKMKTVRETEQADIRERLADQEALCKSLKAVLDGNDRELMDSTGKVQGLKDSWRDIEHPDKRLQKQFQVLADKFDQRILNFKATQANAVRQGWWEKARLLQELEALTQANELSKSEIEVARKKWPEGGSDSIDEILNERFEQNLKGNPGITPATDSIETATDLCIQLEFLAGIASPDKEKDRRMKYQVERLSRSLSGDGGRLSATAEAGMAEQEWLKLPFVPPKTYTKFERRIKAALDEIYRTNNV